MEPRIYLYKVTFEEIPDWYWGIHKEKKYKELYLGSPKTHAWKWEFYTPCLEILEFFPYTNEGWIEAQNVENRCIKPDLNNPLCLNEHCGSVISLEARRRGANKGHEEKDDLGRSFTAVKAGTAAHKEKDDLGRSINAVKAAEKLHGERDDLGRSVHAVKTIGKVHDEKDDLGRSTHSVKSAERLNKGKDDLGRSVNAVKGGKEAAKVTNTQKWKDPYHPELGERTPGNLVQMQQRRGYPHGKENRVRVK